MRNTDIWICRLEPDAGYRHQPVAEDCEAAGCYMNDLSRTRFLASRFLLRSILADYAGMPAAALRFRTGRYGKLHLHSRGSNRVHFNISHSRDRLLIAVSRSGPVGVDVEHLRPIDSAWLARNWFSPSEKREWSRLPRARRLDSFFHAWTCKEAFLKATGLGMAMPLDGFSVSLDPDRAELLEVRGGAPRPWRLTRIETGPDCAAAVVTFGAPGVIRMREAA